VKRGKGEKGKRGKGEKGERGKGEKGGGQRGKKFWPVSIYWHTFCRRSCTHLAHTHLANTTHLQLVTLPKKSISPLKKPVLLPIFVGNLGLPHSHGLVHAKVRLGRIDLYFRFHLLIGGGSISKGLGSLEERKGIHTCRGREVF